MFKRPQNFEAQVEVIDYLLCPAKTMIDERGRSILGRSVFSHCEIVGAVAKEIISRLPKSSQELFPIGSTFTAATHDIGKVSPTFYNKIMNACSEPLLANVNFMLEKEWGGHAGVSQAAAKAMDAPHYVPEILGQHHGFSPNLAGKKADAEVFGGRRWQAEREKLVNALQQTLSESWPQVESAAQARLLAGLTSVADWIGSGRHFEDPNIPWEGKVADALDDAGFVRASYKQGLSFAQVFGFAPKPAQSALIEQASQPGVYVLEAPMGLGKTEAALYVAYQMLESEQASGIYFALPTQLTSNKIYERFNEFLQGCQEKGMPGILADDCEHRSLLLHGTAWLLKTEMGEEGRPGGAWFNHSKRGLLAPFAVGTIDQALMAAMNVKHGFVRAFGLAGKVVILDEVHTYDAYTSTLLDAMVDLLRQLDCTVIILSATLNQERREDLLKRPTKSMDYPLITASPGKDDQPVQEFHVPVGENKPIQVSLHTDDALAIEEALLRAEQGQQVLWIENTVKEAQQRYLDLAGRSAQLGVASGLLHSRFRQDDRQCIEDKWVNLYGKAGRAQRQVQGRILIGTQVLEQSLDIDADFMVSRFAPTDMLLQRLGRLWRHEQTPRCAKAKAEVWLLAPDLNEAIAAPQKSFGKTAFVYSPYVLCRSLEVWQGMQSINLPGDIRSLIERTYVSRSELGEMNRWLRELEEGASRRTGRNAMRQLARLGLAEGGNTLPESKAQTRYSETDSFEVLLLKSIKRDRYGNMATLTLLNGEQIQLPIRNRKLLTKPELRQRTGALMRQIVNVPQSDQPNALPTKLLQDFGLHHCFFLGSPDWPEDESVLRVALVDDTDRLRGIENTDIHAKHRLEYRTDLGYRVITNQEM